MIGSASNGGSKLLLIVFLADMVWSFMNGAILILKNRTDCISLFLSFVLLRVEGA